MDAEVGNGVLLHGVMTCQDCDGVATFVVHIVVEVFPAVRDVVLQKGHLY